MTTLRSLKRDEDLRRVDAVDYRLLREGERGGPHQQPRKCWRVRSSNGAAKGRLRLLPRGGAASGKPFAAKGPVGVIELA